MSQLQIVGDNILLYGERVAKITELPGTRRDMFVQLILPNGNTAEPDLPMVGDN